MTTPEVVDFGSLLVEVVEGILAVDNLVVVAVEDNLDYSHQELAENYLELEENLQDNYMKL